MEDWTPLEDKWKEHISFLTSEVENTIDSGSMPDDLGFPPELGIGDQEREDLFNFVMKRTDEIFRIFYSYGTERLVLKSYLINCILAGMKWERERIG